MKARVAYLTTLSAEGRGRAVEVMLSRPFAPGEAWYKTREPPENSNLG